MKGKTNITLLALIGVFLLIYFIPFSAARVSVANGEAFVLLSEYARNHPGRMFMYRSPPVQGLVPPTGS